jgi:3-methylfumaryl-CoA hydratase
MKNRFARTGQSRDESQRLTMSGLSPTSSLPRRTRLSATLDYSLDRPAAGTRPPPLWHWLYFLPLYRQSAVGPDGHPKRGDFLPPVPLPRRMCKPARVAARAAPVASDRLRKRRTHRHLVFVKVVHGVTSRSCVTESTTSFGHRRRTGTPRAAPGAAWQRNAPTTCCCSDGPTFNGHRILRPAIRDGAEGYPGLIVGPLIATLLLDLLRRERPAAEVARFDFRAVRPLFDINRFRVCGQPQPDGTSVRLWARDHEGALAMDATATIR